MKSIHAVWRITLFVLAFFPSILFAQMNPEDRSYGLTVALPWANSYRFYDYDLLQSKSKSGFFGLGIALYYKEYKWKGSADIGITGDLPVPIGAFDYAKEGTRSSIASIYIDGSIHRKIFEQVYAIGGINLVNYRYNFTSYVDSLPSYLKKDPAAGITLGAEYVFNNVFSIAILYKPAIVNFGHKQYRHLLSLDARFDINVIEK